VNAKFCKSLTDFSQTSVSGVIKIATVLDVDADDYFTSAITSGRSDMQGVIKSLNFTTRWPLIAWENPLGDLSHLLKGFKATPTSRN
jgi:hypothetical protein